MYAEVDSRIGHEQRPEDAYHCECAVAKHQREESGERYSVGCMARHKAEWSPAISVDIVENFLYSRGVAGAQPMHERLDDAR